MSRTWVKAADESLWRTHHCKPYKVGCDLIDLIDILVAHFQEGPKLIRVTNRFLQAKSSDGKAPLEVGIKRITAKLVQDGCLQSQRTTWNEVYGR